jgi:uncharacterized protein
VRKHVKTNTTRFPPGVSEKIGYYVYCLIAPGSSKPFYVGKGKGNRVFVHAAAAIKSDRSSSKLDEIRKILLSGRQVKYQIIRHGLTEKEAFEIEATLIDYLNLHSLANEVAGHEMNDRGQMTAIEISAKYRAAPARIKEPLLLIIINRLFRQNATETELYQAARGNWVLGRRKDKAKYALAVYRGIVRAAYSIESWKSVPVLSQTGKVKIRWRFRGAPAPELDHYLGKSVTRYIKKGSQSPVLYLNCR